MKTLHSFTIKDKEDDVKIDIVAPSRAVAKEAEMIYAKTYGQCVRGGLLSNAEAIKINEERGGVLTDSEKEEYLSLLKDYFTKEQELTAVKGTKETPKEGEEKIEVPDEPKKKKKVDTKILEEEVKSLRSKIMALQSRQDAILENTAETKARDETIFFNVLSLTYREGKQFFHGSTFKEKAEWLDSKGEDPLIQKVYRRGVWYISALYYGVNDLSKLEYQGDE